jgi:hypothetical protein
MNPDETAFLVRGMLRSRGRAHWTSAAGAVKRARMRRSHKLAGLIVVAASAAGFCRTSLAGDSVGRVTLLRTPDGGIQPQAAIDASGVIHLVFYKGDPSAGDVFYTRLAPGRAGFDPPIQVNSRRGSAVAGGTIRGAQLALGRKGCVHVAWNGSMKTHAPKRGEGSMYYARSTADRTAFEPERNVMLRSEYLDGGGTLAADAQGRVIVAWHAHPLEVPGGEVYRRMYVARSVDDGATFSPEEPALARETGACACCGTRALATSTGAVHILFRAAENSGSDRDMMLLSSRDRGDHFDGVRLHAWRVNMCPMSSESLAESPRGVIAAWETEGQVYIARIDPKTGQTSTPIHPRGSGGNRKHPAIASNSRGETLIAWAEDTSYHHGGSLAWRILDASHKSTNEAGRVEGGIPHNSLPTAVARPDGGFTVIH